MLQSIGDRSQGWLAWIIITIVCVTFAFFGIHNYLGGSADTNSPVVIDGEPISKQEVDFVYQRLRRQQQIQLGAEFTLNQSLETQLKQQALNEVILSHILTKAARKGGYRIAQSQMTNAIARMPIFQVNGQFSKQRFEEVLRSLLYTDNAFLNDLHTTMLISQVQAGIIGSAFALPSEVESAIKLINQKRDIAYLIIPAARFVPNVQVSNEQIQTYYQQHTAEFAVPERVSVEYIELSLTDLAAKIRIDEARLRQYYQDNLANYTKAPRMHLARILLKVNANETSDALKLRANELMVRLQKGEDFATLAKQYSADTRSAKRGGELGWFNKNDLDANLMKGLNNLQKVGDITAPLQNQEGLNIIKLIGIEKPQVQPFAKVRADIEKAMAKQQARQLFAEQSDKLANLTYIHPNSLNDAAKTMGLTIKTTGLFTKEGNKADISANPKVIAVAFNPDVLVRGNNSDVIELSSDNVIVLRIKQHQPATVKPIAEMRNSISNILKNKIAQQKAEELGQGLLQRMQQGENSKTLAKQYNLNWQYQPNAGRYDTNIDTAILAKAFRMPHPNKPNSFISAGMAMPKGGYAIVALTGVHDGDFAAMPEVKRHIFQQQIENSLGQIDYEMYVRGLVNKAKIVTKEPQSAPLTSQS